MKKRWIVILIFFFGISSVYALSHFSVDSNHFSFYGEKKENNIENAIPVSYQLHYEISNEDSKEREEIVQFAKKVTRLLLRKRGTKEENALEYHKRYEQYLSLRYAPSIPKDPLDDSKLDKNSQEYKDDLVSGLVVPNMFRILDEMGIEYTTIGSIRMIKNGDEIAVAVSLPSITMKQENQRNRMEYQVVTTDLVLYYIFKKLDGEYKIYYIKGETNEALSEYFNEVERKEAMGRLGVADYYYDEEYQNLYDYSQLEKVSKEQKQSILQKNANSIVILNSYYNNNLVVSGHGFFLKKGILVTSWSYLEKSLKDAQYLVIKDYLGNFYELEGIITMNREADLAVLKLKEEKGVPVTLSHETITKEMPVFMISSKSGMGYILQSGITISSKGYYQNLLPILESDVGSPLLDLDGNVLGINVGKSLNTSLSVAVPKESLEEVLSKIENQSFQTIPSIPFSSLKEEYYYIHYQEEFVKNTIPNKIWEEYSKIGDIENTISLSLVKASYHDNIVSLRYQNTISDYIHNLQFTTTFRKSLSESGYEEISRSEDRIVYQNKNYRVIMMDYFHYLVIIMVKL